jgi:hypothetical protein
MPEDDYTPGDNRLQIKVLACNVHNGQRSVRTLVRQYSTYWWRMKDGSHEVRSRWEWSRNVRDNEITHWKSLPELPSDEKQEAIDVAPVVHGEWINCMNGNATCSVCGIRSKAVYDLDNEQHYFGHCGAKMDGGSDAS